MPKHNTYYLVEKFNPRCDYAGKEVIALNPEACHDLGNAGITYRAVNECFCEEELQKDAGSYFYEQIDWFKRFDAFLKDKISYCAANGINLAIAHYNPLKYLVDSYISCSFILRSLLKDVSGSRVIFVTSSCDLHPDYDLYRILRPRSSFYAQILPAFCRQYGLPLECIADTGPAPEPGRQAEGALRDRIKGLLLRLHLKSLQSFIRYKRHLLFRRPGSGLDSAGVLFLHTGDYQIDFVFRYILGEGARAFTMSKDLILREGRYTQNIALDFSKPHAGSFTDTVKKECLQAALAFKKEGSLSGWISDKCQLDVSAPIMPYLDNFINQICAQDIVKIDKLSDFYVKEKIDFIVVRSSSGRDSAFSLAAADKCGLKRICLQHGSTAYEQPALLMTDVYFFDYYLATDSLSQKYLQERANNGIFGRCEILQSAHYLSSLGEPLLKKSRRFKETIIYAPCHTPAGVYNFNIPMYEPNWYSKFLKELLDYLCRRKDKLFIFKYCQGNNWVDRVTVPYIRSNNFANIRLENKPLITYLHRADRIILDYPSTGFFESAAAKIPALSLYGRNYQIWGYARDFFGPMLQPFAEAKEAMAHIDNFLASDRKKYITELSLKKTDIIDLFHQMKAAGS